MTEAALAIAPRRTISDKVKRILDAPRNSASDRERYSCTDQFRRECFGGSTPTMVTFLSDIFSAPTVVQASQARFYKVFSKIGRDLRMHGTATGVPKPGTPPQDGFLVLYSSLEFADKGAIRYPIELSIEWISRFYMLPETHRYFTNLIEVPRSFVTCIRRENYPQSIRNFICDRILRSETPDRHFFDDGTTAFGGSDSLSLLYFDEHILRSHQQNTSEIAIEVRQARLSKLKSKEETRQEVKRERLDRILYTSYVYLLYKMFEVDHELLKRALPDCKPERRTHTMMRFFPLMLAMLNGADHYEVRHAPIIRLFRHYPEMLHVVARAAEDVRGFLIRLETMPVLGVRQSSNQLLASIYESTAVLNEIMGLYMDVRHKLAAEKRFVRWTRWLYVNTVEVPFCTFIHSLDLEMQSVEYRAIHNWFNEQRPSLVVPKYDAICTGFSPSLSGPLEVQQHIKLCDQEFAVMRFGKGVRYYVARMTMDHVAQNYSTLFHCLRTGTSNVDWISRVWLLGCDHIGPYLIIRRDYLLVLQLTCFIVSLTSFRFNKNMPVFPIMARMLFLTYTMSAGVAPMTGIVQQLESKEISPPPRFERHDDYSLYCVVQVLCHWLRLGSPAKGQGNKHKSFVATDTGSTTTTTMLQNIYVPGFDEDHFPCMLYINRLCDQLKRGGGEGDAFPNIACINAVRDFLEIRRPRRVRISALIKMLREIGRKGSESETVRRHIHLLRLIEAILLASASPVNSRVPLAKKVKSEGPATTGVEFVDFVYDDRIGAHLKLSTDVLPNVPADKRTAEMNWLLYAPMLNNELDPKLVYELLCEKDNIVMADRERLTEAQLENTAASANLAPAAEYDCGNDTVDHTSLPEYFKMYAKCFVVPYPGASGARLAERFAANHEPMDALVGFMRGLEARVSGKTFAAAIKHMPFDLDEFLEERPPESCDLSMLSPDSTSMLPIQARIDMRASDSLLPTSFVFFETSIPVLTIVGHDYDALRKSMGTVYAHLTNGNDSADVALDLLLRFRGDLSQERVAKSELAGRMLRFIEEDLTKMESSLMEREPPYFETFAQVLRKIESEKAPPLSPIDKSLLTDTRKFTATTAPWSSDTLRHFERCLAEISRHGVKNEHGIVENGSFLLYMNASAVANASLQSQY